MQEYNISHQAVMENDEVTGILSIKNFIGGVFLCKGWRRICKRENKYL